MKKIFLSVFAIMAMTISQAFGMYGPDNGWIDFLVHGNQFRARLNQLGFVLGNGTFKGTFGFETGANIGGILTTTNFSGVQHLDFLPTISMGLGYTSPLIGVGLGYNATLKDRGFRSVQDKAKVEATHTPVLMINALDNRIRIAIPIQVYSSKYLDNNTTTVGTSTYRATNDMLAVSLDTQMRFYTGLDVLSQVRLWLWYGMGQNKNNTDKVESFGFQFRAYFGATLEEVALAPYLNIRYRTALGKNHTGVNVTAVSVMNNGITTLSENQRRDVSHYDIRITPALGLTANSDIVSIYLEPSLGLAFVEDGWKSTKIEVGLAWDAYAEIYINPLPNLQWLFTAYIGNDANSSYTVGGKSLYFDFSTGIHWYLPAL